MDLSYNRMYSFNNKLFQPLIDLEFLSISGNEFTAVPKQALQTLTNLKVLNIRNNHIKVIQPYDFKGLPLQRLDIGDNTAPLRLDRYAFCGLEPVRTTPQPGVTEWAGLHTLVIDYNGIVSLDPCISNILWTLSTIEMTGNPLLCDCRLFYIREQINNIRLPLAQCAAPSLYAGLILDHITPDMYNCTWSSRDYTNCSTLCPPSLTSNLASPVCMDAHTTAVLLTYLILLVFNCLHNITVI